MSLLTLLNASAPTVKSTTDTAALTITETSSVSVVANPPSMTGVGTDKNTAKDTTTRNVTLTPAVGEQLIAKFYIESGMGSTLDQPVVNISSTGGGGLTWTHIGTYNDNTNQWGSASIWKSSPVTAATSTTVTTSAPQLARGQAFVVERWSGAVIGNGALKGNGTTVPSFTAANTDYSSTFSWISGDYNFASGTGRTYTGNTTESAYFATTGDGFGGTVYSAYTRAASGSITTYGMSAPNPQKWVGVGVEITAAPLVTVTPISASDTAALTISDVSSVIKVSPVSTLTDDFSSSATSATKWSINSPSSVSGGVAITPASSAYPSIASQQLYELRNSSMSVQLVSTPALVDGTQAIFLAFNSDFSASVGFVWSYDSGVQNLSMRIPGSADTTIPYSSTNHLYLRVRDASGTTYLETSPNGSTWTQQRTVATPVWASTVYPNLQAGNYSSLASGYGQATWDNFNIATTVIATSDTSSITTTESSSVVVTISTTDTAALTIAESSSIAVTVTTTDTAALTISDSSSLGSTPINTTDTAAITISDASGVTSTLPTTDTASITIAESRTLAGSSTSTDTASITITETSSVFVTQNTTDTSSVSIADVSAVQAGRATTDTAAVTITESSNVGNTQSTTDTSSVSIADVSQLTALVSTTDTSSVSVSEVSYPFIIISAVDSSSVAIGENSSDSSTANASDTASVTITDTSNVFVTVGGAPGGTIFSDDFNRADSATLGANWVSTAASGTIGIVGNKAGNGSTSQSVQWATPVPSGQPQFAQMTSQGINNTGPAVAMSAFSAGTGRTTNDLYYFFKTSTGASISRRTNGSGFSLGANASTTQTVNAGDVMRIEYDGATLKGYINGVLVISFAESTLALASHQYVGMEQNGGNLSAIGDDWSGGSTTGSTTGADTSSVTITETSSVFAVTNTTDTSSVSVADASTSALSTTTTDTSSVSIADVSSITLTNYLPTTDTSAITITESSSVSGTVSTTDTSSVSIAETSSVSILTLVSTTDTASISIADVSTSTSTLNTTDTAAVTISDVSTSSLSLNRTDTAAVTIADVSSVLSVTNTTDTASVTIADASQVVTIFATSDTSSVSISETSAPYINVNTTDISSVTITDVSANQRNMSSTETTAVTISDVSTSFITVNAVDSSSISVGEASTEATTMYVPTTDTASITITESSAPFVTLSTTDTSSVSIADASTSALSLSRTDTAAVTITESAQPSIAFSTADTASVSIAESSTIAVSFSTTDTAAVSIGEAATIYITQSTNDTSTLSIADVASVRDYGYHPIRARYQGQWRDGIVKVYVNGVWKVAKVKVYALGAWN